MCTVWGDLAAPTSRPASLPSLRAPDDTERGSGAYQVNHSREKLREMSIDIVLDKSGTIQLEYRVGTYGNGSGVASVMERH